MQPGGGEVSSSSAFGANSAVFVVRVWREKREDPDAIAAGVPGPCRGWIEHVATGARHYFTTYAEMTRHLQRYAACAMVEGDTVPPHASTPLRVSLRERLHRLLVGGRGADDSPHAKP